MSTRLLLLACGLGWLGLALVIQTQLRAQPASAVPVLQDENFTDGAAPAQAGLRGWTPNADGLTLLPGARGTLQLPLTAKASAELLTLQVWLYGAPDRPVRLSCQDGTGTRHLRRITERLVKHPVDVAGCTAREGTIHVTVDAENGTNDQALIVDKLLLQGRVGSIDLPARAWLWVLLGAVVVAAALTRDAGWQRWLLGAGLVALGDWLLGSRWCTTASLGVLLHVPLLLAATRLPAMLVVTLSLALALRWQELLVTGTGLLPPDALAVADIATQMQFLYDTAFREPLWVWFAKASATVTGQPLVGLQLWSLVCSALLAPLGGLIAYGVWRTWWAAVVAALFLAAHPILVAQGADGLRTAFNAGVVGAAVGVGLIHRERWRWAAAAVVLAAGGLMQFSSLPVVGGLLVLHWTARPSLREGVGGVLVPVMAVGILLAPHLLNSSKKFGDPLWSSNVHGAFYRNYEFVRVKGTGCEGCPTLDTLEREGSYAGAPVTVGGYIFGMHTPGEVIRRVGEGYVTVFLRPGQYLWTLLGWPYLAFYGVYLMGLAVLLLTRTWSVLAALLLPLNLLAFLVPIGMDPRLALAAVVPVSLTLAGAVTWGVHRFAAPAVRVLETRPATGAAS